MQSEPYISVVVPVYNGGVQLEQCLAALLASDFRAREIIVADDASTDASAATARSLGVAVVSLAARSGPAAARNHGARRARGEVLLFIDADVVVRRDTLARVAATFRARPDIAAVFGSYDDAPEAANFVSQYKNLLHHHVHQQASAEAATFWAGCGAVRRAAFERAGGFDAVKYARPSIEDIELGYRLRRGGGKIILDRELQVKHLKRWTLAVLLRTDIHARALPWTRLILEQGALINDLNLRVAQRVCAALTGTALVLLALSYFNALLAAFSLVALAIVALINLPLLRFFARRRGAWFAARAFGLQLLYYFYSGTVFALCYAAHALKRARAGVGLDGRRASAGTGTNR
ncbi:MAG TPA: glycosyltransferase family 2 protein [Pyrinomonadaceae bacterium]|nr:glycosyltransferase family 2 protein [Pyrinomonadaceae bacterium]